MEHHDKKTGEYSVHYTDGDKEKLRLQDEVWKDVRHTPTEAQPGTASTNDQEEDSIAAGEVQLSPGQELQSSEKDLIEKYYEAFGHGEFMLQQAHGLPPYAT